MGSLAAILTSPRHNVRWGGASKSAFWLCVYEYTPLGLQPPPIWCWGEGRFKSSGLGEQEPHGVSKFRRRRI
jgi:hypothetical protein